MTYKRFVKCTAAGYIVVEWTFSMAALLAGTDTGSPVVGRSINKIAYFSSSVHITCTITYTGCSQRRSSLVHACPSARHTLCYTVRSGLVNIY